MSISGEIRVGLVVAKPNDQIGELKRFLSSDSVDVFLFPEGFLHSDNINQACKIVQNNSKWLITGVEDRRIPGKKYQTGIVINPDGLIVGEHKKTSIGGSEVEGGYSRGDSINVIDTDFGKIGIGLCYEIFFPEVSRVYTLNGADIIFNPIGTGMFHEQQYNQWNSIACARASENRLFVLGCSHYNDAIPIAFAYAPNGECIKQSRNTNELIVLKIDLKKYTFTNNYFKQRRPRLYGDLTRIPKD